MVLFMMKRILAAVACAESKIMRVSVTKLTDKFLVDRACSFTVGSSIEVKSLYKMYMSEHSPSRTQLFWVEMEDIPSFVSTHLVRHHVGVEHFCSSRREDRFDPLEGSTATLLGLTQAGLHEIFEYNNGVLYWKVSPLRGDAFKIGDIAGTVGKDGRYVISRNSKRALRYRIIYLMHKGYCPAMLDHINGDCADDRIENLRATTKQLNAANIKKKGFKGVTKHHTGKYKACIMFDSVPKYLGLFSSEEDAAAAYDIAALRYFGEHASLNFPNSELITRDTLVNHAMLLNAQTLINMARKRLCAQASLETRLLMQEIKFKVAEVDADLAACMLPECDYRGGVCWEFKCCGYRPKGE